ncbi:MAG: hypothetical protein JSR58_08045 [Verrucomicrobia bacterium]|nr:hypothetical protein [Verrucomicrobiota bacterium]
MTTWLNPYNYIKSNQQEQVHSSIDGITGEKGAKLFQAFIYGAMGGVELGDNICRLFPMKNIESCNIDGNKFAVQFQKETQAKITQVESGGEKTFEGAIFSIPNIVKGTFTSESGKLEFDASHALKISLLLCDKQVGWGTWSKQVSANSPFIPLYSVQYVEKTNNFTLSGVSGLSVTVSREVFEATFKNYTFS